MKEIKTIELYKIISDSLTGDCVPENEDNIEYLLDTYEFPEEDKEYLIWYCTHGDDKQDYIDNLISYCEYLKRKESL